MPIQTQAEANAYWADQEWKKWVVEFTAGARRAAFIDMDNRGQTWARNASATVRLATADDLGCVRTSGGTPT